MAVTPDRSATADSDELAEFGYKQELDRTLGNFHTFAAGISYISILTGTFQLFYFGFAFGGPAYWWSWPMVFAGQLMVALCFCELAARYPVAGSIYNWAKRLSTPHVAWLAGWMMLTASIVTVAAVALAYQITLPQISGFFQFYGDGTGKYDYAVNAVILGTVLIVFTTIINAIGVKLMAQINSSGVFIELFAAVLLILALAINITRGPDVVMDTQGRGADWELGYLGAFLAASLASAYVMYGFDTASSLGEESHNPRKNAPRAILRALIASFIIGGLILLFAMMSVTNINSPEISTGGLQYIILDVLGNTIGDIFLWCVVIAITVCCLAVHTAAIRMMFAMARDNNLPAGEHLAKIDPRTKTPIIPAVSSAARDPDPRGEHPPAADLRGGHEHRDHHDLHRVPARHGPDAARPDTRRVAPGGRAGGLLLARPLGLRDQPRRGGLGRLHGDQPRLAAASIYNATEPFHWYLKWGAVLFVGMVMLGGFAYYWFVQRHKTGTLAAHALEEPARRPAERRGAVDRAAVDDVAAFLRRHPPFDSLDADGVAAVARAARPEDYPAGAPILERPEETAAYAFVVRRGTVELRSEGRLLDVVGEGELFGFASILAERPVGFVARAREDTLVYRVAADAIRPVLERPAALPFVARSLSARLLAAPEPARRAAGGRGRCRS